MTCVTIETKFRSLRLFDQTFLTNILPFLGLEITNKQQRKCKREGRESEEGKEGKSFNQSSFNLAWILREKEGDNLGFSINLGLRLERKKIWRIGLSFILVGKQKR